MKTIALGLSMAALAFGGGAYAAQDLAQSPAGPARGTVRGDADGNGVLTRAEAQARAAQQFARMDATKDGKIDTADRQARREARRGEMFARLDTDKNGQISRAEFMADRGPAAGEPGRAGKRGKHGMRHGRHGGPRGAMGPGMMRPGAKGPMTEAQFTAAALARFDAMDANKDGQVTPEERQAARAKMRAKWQEMRAQKTQN